VFAAAAELGIGLVIDPMVRAEHWQNASDIAATADALNAAAKLAAEHGVRVGYHNHWWELESRIDGRSGLEVLADALGPEVDLEVDTYWATAGGENAAELLKRLGARVKALHIKDGGLNTDASGQVPAGTGQVPVNEVLAAAPDALRVIEFDEYDGDIYAGIEGSYAFVSGAAR
jgi:sugar phosphate isomerase/epimerase